MRFINYLKFMLERFLVRGAHYQLLAVAGFIGLVSVVAGSLLRLGTDDAETFPEAVWWAFLRLSDPGYLGDDVGIARRVISTAVTVLGYVLFMGSLVAIMSQWLNGKMRQLEAGYTPVVKSNHLLVLGWTARAAIVIRDFLLSEDRVRRFLQPLGGRHLHVVLLAERVSADLMQELATRVGPEWDPADVTLRSGTALRSDHLHRVDFLNAAAIVLPAQEFGDAGATSADTYTIKALLSISNHPSVEDPEDLPLAVAEILDARKAGVARSAYRGPIEVIPSDAIISRLIAQTLRHPGLSSIYNELLPQGDGNEVYVREVGDLAGATYESLDRCFPSAVCIGVVRGYDEHATTHLNPPPGFEIEAGDRFVLIAEDYERSALAPDARPDPVERGEPVHAGSRPDAPIRVLMLGYNHKVGALLAELGTYPGESFEVTLMSQIPVDERRRRLSRHDLHPERVRVEHVETDYTVPKELRAVDPKHFDHVVMMASDHVASREESDARTIEGYLLVLDALEGADHRPEAIIELVDPSNVGLLGDRPGEVIVSPVLVSHMLAQVTLRRDLNAVFGDLFTSEGPEITFRPASELVEEGAAVDFTEVQRAAHRRGETAIGLRLGGRHGGVLLNPPRDEVHRLEPEDEIVVLATYT